MQRQKHTHFNDAVVGRVRVKSILDVALSHNAKVPHNFDSCLSQHVVLSA